MALIFRFSVLVTISFAVALIAPDPGVSRAQSGAATQSFSTGTNLVAVMPDTAQIGWWVLPADQSWFAGGFSGNLLIVEQRWLIAPGVSVDADCSVAPPVGEVAELMPLEQLDGEQASSSFLASAGARTISLSAHLDSSGKPQVSLRALLLAHTDPLTEAIVVRIRLIAF